MDFKTDKELLRVFHRMKTKISCMEHPCILLSQLKDNGLISKDKYQKLTKAKAKHTMVTRVYDYLDWLEKNQPQTIRRFWSCVFEEHILQQYPDLSSMRKMLDDKLSDKGEDKSKKAKEREKKVEDRHTSEGKAVRKRKHKEEERAEEEGPDPSSSSSNSPFRPTFQEDEDTEEEGLEGVSEEDVDLSAFADASLPVTCGSARGILQKGRFATGTSGKCIRTEDKWLTPVEFLKEDPKLIDPHWKISIRCLGEPLKFLLEKQVLRVHSLLCVCRLCSSDEHDLKQQGNDDYCFICNNDGDLLCCDGCPRAFHYGCHIPSVDQNTLGDTWMCTYCVLCTSQKWRYPCQISHQKVLQSGISDYLLVNPVAPYSLSIKTSLHYTCQSVLQPVFQ